jgi:hypothetical protein
VTTQLPIDEDKQILLPKRFLVLQAISKPLAIGFAAAMAFVVYGPGVKSVLSKIIIIPAKTDPTTLYDCTLIVLILLSLPFIVMAGVTLPNLTKK